MGKAQKKTGKGRIDKFYKLAKSVRVWSFIITYLVAIYWLQYLFLNDGDLFVTLYSEESKATVHVLHLNLFNWTKSTIFLNQPNVASICAPLPVAGYKSQANTCHLIA